MSDWGRINRVKIALGSVTLSMIVVAGGCARNETKAPDVSASVRSALDQAGFKDISVKEDRDKGVVTLDGHVASDADKAQAESIAKSNAGSLVVADQVAVLPPNDQSTAKDVNSDLDKGIEKNLDAAFTQSHMKKAVSYSVKNGVVTLTGHLDSQATRTQVANIANQVPNVKQVVNETDVRHQRATASR
jgi:osmotically-inducible protein OsmY